MVGSGSSTASRTLSRHNAIRTPIRRSRPGAGAACHSALVINSEASNSIVSLVSASTTAQRRTTATTACRVNRPPPATFGTRNDTLARASSSAMTTTPLRPVSRL